MNSAMIPDIAEILIKAGKEIIMPAYRTTIQATHKADGSVVTETDLACQHYIEQALQKIDAEIGFLGEEMSREKQLACLNSASGTYWCLDPLDGTTNFTTSFPGFAISLALIRDGAVEMAWIHDPVRNETFTAIRSGGAFLNGDPIHSSDELELCNCVGFIDFKRLESSTASHFATGKIFRSQRNIGSCALEWAWLSAGRGQFIIHGGEKIWDFAAGSLIATESGCLVGDFSGHPLFPTRSLSSPILATCSSTIQEKLKLQLSCQTT